jgi:hypothetical protein
MAAKLTTYSAQQKARKLLGARGYAEYRVKALTREEKDALKPRRDELRALVKAW